MYTLCELFKIYILFISFNKPATKYITVRLNTEKVFFGTHFYLNDSILGSY